MTVLVAMPRWELAGWCLLSGFCGAAFTAVLLQAGQRYGWLWPL